MARATGLNCAFREVFSKAAVLDKILLIYLHCMKVEYLEVFLPGIDCMQLVFRQVHISFVRLERRVALIPVVAAVQFDDVRV